MRRIWAPSLLFLLLVAAFPQAVRADEGLQVVTATRYEVLPEQGRVHVTIDASATSLTPDTATERIFYGGITLTVQPGASAINASAAGISISATVVEATDLLTQIEIDFDRGVFFGDRYDFQLSFDVFDPGGLPERDVRITPSFVAFPIWAFGTSGSAGGSVVVVVPESYTTSVPFGRLVPEPADGATILRADAISEPLDFFAYITAERFDAYTGTDLTIAVGEREAHIELQAWEDDHDWLARMQSLLTDGLPALAEAIGLDYPISGALTVREGAFARLGDYAGIYDERERSIEIRYDADAFVGLHEAAHIWFNGDLFDARWITEAFASFYAEEAGRRLDLELEPLPLTDDLRRFAIPLNDWGGIGEENLNVEDYAYAATNEVGRLIAGLASIDGLQAVWLAAATDELAYQPQHAARPEISQARTAEDWQRLLDLLEERTSADFDPLWREWILNSGEAPMLEERETTRTAYAAAMRAAEDWELPTSIRLVMSAWQFEDANARIEDATEILDDRERIETAAAELGLTPSRDLQQRFEADSLSEAAAEAAGQLSALAQIRTTTHDLARAISGVETIGLIGLEPQATLDDARDAFEISDETRAVALAQTAARARADAEGRGRERVAIGGTGLLAIDGLFLLGLLARRRRLRRAAAKASLPLVNGNS